MEADNFLHPLLPSGGTVRVDVHPLGHLGVRLACHDPSAENGSLSYYSSLSLADLTSSTVVPTLSMTDSVCLVNEGSIVAGSDKILRQSKEGGGGEF